MKALILFDTSVLIAGFVASHPNHHAALSWLQRAKNNELIMLVSAHTLAECYAVLTRLPVSPKISPSTARLLVRENIEKLAKIISLSSADYLNILDQAANLGFSGGII